MGIPMNESSVRCADARELAQEVADESIDLVLTDPPFYGIVAEEWDNQWNAEGEFVAWLLEVFQAYWPKLKEHGSLVFFAGMGKHGSHPVFDVIRGLERSGWTFRNLLTWKKRRGYGKSHDYLYCREEILWFSKSSERTNVRFNIPLLEEKRGYAGFDPKYPAKSEFKRVSNVWDDIPELMRPRRSCEKPVPLLRRLVETHSNVGDLVLDPFVGAGTTAVACKELGRLCIASDVSPEAVAMTEERLAKGKADK